MNLQQKIAWLTLEGWNFDHVYPGAERGDRRLYFDFDGNVIERKFGPHEMSTDMYRPWIECPLDKMAKIFNYLQEKP
jgi:hypothetical protein